MRNTTVSILVSLVMLLGSVLSAQAQLAATIDRNQIVLNETLTLTIIKDGRSSISSDDLQPLEKDFWIVGQSKSSNTQFSNGSLSSSFTLNLVLSPKRAGNLEIPTLAIGNEHTNSLKVKVVTQAQPKTKADIAPLYIETEVSQKTVLVQSQLIFTLRIFWAVEASITDPADPQLKDVLMERLQDTTFNKVIDDQTYKVFERKYAIFPQQSGVLEIPQIIVQATIPNQQHHGQNIYDLFGTRGEQIRLRSESETVTVAERPAGYPVGAEWLPTDKLSIAEEWSQAPEELQVGESVTLTIGMAATGLMGAQLPPVELPETAGVKLYQGKAEVQDLSNPDGITGVRKESIALIPIRAGQVELPEIRIPWWNVGQQQVEYAVIPARQLRIREAPVQSSQAIMAPPSLNNGAAGEGSVSLPSSTIAPQGGANLNKSLLALCLGLVVAWLITLFLLVRNRRQVRGLLARSVEGAGSNIHNDIKETVAYRKFVQACRDNDPGLARKAVVAWAQTLFPEERVRTAADLARLFPDSRLLALVDEIDTILYGQSSAPVDWCGQNLLTTVTGIHKSGMKRQSKQPALAKLYQ